MPSSGPFLTSPSYFSLRMSESKLPPLAQATAGACGSLVSNTVVYPLDLLSTRLQTQSRGRDGKSGYGSIGSALREIFEKSGIAGLYQGWGADSLSSSLSNFLFFYFRGFLVETLRRRRSASLRGEKVKTFRLSTVEDLCVGMLAGAISRFFTTPLSNVTVRLQTSATPKAKDDKGKGKEKASDESESDDEDEYGSGPGIFETMRDIVQEKGVVGLWSGYETAVLLSITPALTFSFSHIISRAALSRSAQEKPSAWQTFAVNAAGNSLSTILLFPLILSKTRLQWKSPSGRRMYRSLADVLRKTIKRNGVAGLYQGLESQLLKGLVSHGTTMVVKQRVETLFITLFLVLSQRSGRLKLSS